MRFRAALLRSSLAALLLLALAAGSAFAQIIVQPPTGGNRLITTNPSERPGSVRGWYASLLPGSWTNAAFRLPGKVSIVPVQGVAKRVAR